MTLPILGSIAAVCAVGFVFALEACSTSQGLPPITSLDTTVARSSFGVVSTSFAESTEAGVRVLEDGGNAIDAAVAAAFVGFSSAPGSCGLFGTTYLVIHFADGRDIAIDGSGRVPLRVSRQELATLQAEGRLHGIKVAAVPGSLAALDHALAKYGTMSLADVLQPAITAAEKGVLVTRSKQAAIDKYIDTIREGEYIKQLLLVEGSDVPEVGTIIRQSELATTMRRLAKYGAAEFYRGAIAHLIDEDMKKRGGYVTFSDLAIYRVTEQQPLRGTYRGTDVITFPWPGAGGAVIEALNVLEEYRSDFLKQPSADRLQAFIEAFHISLEDHTRFTMRSSVSGNPPNNIYTAKKFAANRADLISFDHALSEEILGAKTNFYTPPGGTTQISVVDRFGNVVSLTQTLGRFFGARAMAPGLGIVYNSFLEGYNYQIPTAPSARVPCPTDMSPTIVLKDGHLVMALGSSGSRRIPAFVAQVISNVVDRRMGVREAVLAPRVAWDTREEPGVLIEVFPPNTGNDVEILEGRGYQIVNRIEFPATSRDFIRCGAINAVVFDPERQEYAAVGDPRRQGVAGAAQR